MCLFKEVEHQGKSILFGLANVNSTLILCKFKKKTAAVGHFGKWQGEIQF